MASIAVVGGTGYAGSLIVAEAASRGHKVVSYSRSAPAVPTEGVTYDYGSVVNTVPDLTGSEVVVAALSPRGELTGKLSGIYAELAQSAARAGARFVVIGGFSALRPAPDAPRFAEGDLPPEIAAEALEMYAVLKDFLAAPEGLDWLFVSPAAGFGAHMPGEERDEFRVGGEVALFDADGNSAISGIDFARAVIREIEQEKHHRTVISVAY